MGSGSSLYVMVQWLDLFFTQHDHWRLIFPYFRHGLAYSVEMPLSGPPSVPPLPSVDETKTFTSVFFLRIQPISPVIDCESFSESLRKLRIKMASTDTTRDAKDYPLLACAYAIVSMGADEAEGRVTEMGARYLEWAYSLYANVLAVPYLNSVQALLLLSIALRSRGKDGASWAALGQAIRIAQSIGLHRHISRADGDPFRGSEPSADEARTSDLHSRIWWTAYKLEKLMALETGRPSSIQDSECDQILPRPPTIGKQSAMMFDFFGALISLAKIQTRIFELLYQKKKARSSTEQLLHEMGRLDRALLDWAGSIPEEIRSARIESLSHHSNNGKAGTRSLLPFRSAAFCHISHSSLSSNVRSFRHVESID